MPTTTSLMTVSIEVWPRIFQTKPTHDPAWPLNLLERPFFEAAAAGWRFFRRRPGEFLFFFRSFSKPCQRLEGAAAEVPLQVIRDCAARTPGALAIKITWLSSSFKVSLRWFKMEPDLILTPLILTHRRDSPSTSLTPLRCLRATSASSYPLLQPERCAPISLRMCPDPFYTLLKRPRARTRGSCAPYRFYLFGPSRESTRGRART